MKREIELMGIPTVKLQGPSIEKGMEKFREEKKETQVKGKKNMKLYLTEIYEQRLVN